MKKIQSRAVYILFSFLCFLNKCDANRGICPLRIKMDVEKNRIVFCVGDFKEEWPYVSSEALVDVIILETIDKTIHPVITDKTISSLDWRMVAAESELWVCVSKDSLWGTRYQLMSFNKDTSGGYVVTKTIKSPEIIVGLRWSPDGKILAGRPKSDFSLFASDKKALGSVAVSFNYGKQVTLFSEYPVLPMSLFWRNDNAFYAQGTDCKTIMELYADSQKLSLIETNNYKDEVVLFGVFETKPVYRFHGDIYIGDELVYDSETTVGWLKINEPYISFVEKTNIVVLNVNKKEIIKKNIEKTETVNIGVMPKTGKIYWLSDFKEICCWNFEQQGDIEIESIYKLANENGVNLDEFTKP